MNFREGKPQSPAVLTAIGVSATLILALVVVMVLLRTGGDKAVSDNAALIGALVALGGVFTTQIVSIALEDRRTQKARDLESQRAQEAALQNYLEHVGSLLIEKPLRQASPGDNLSTVVSAQTSAVLKGLDSDRKGILLQFLYASDLLQGDKPVVHLERVDLVGANLAGAFLAGANLAGAFLAGANLAGATLVRANLTGSILQAVDFGDTNLRGANLAGADLRKALHLTEEQVRGTIGSEGPNGTKLADGIPRPGAWKRNIDEQRRNTELYSALQVLWVDDNPTNNAQEIKIMNELGATITLARSTDEALDKVRHEQFDVIISDMGRREHGRDDYRAGYDLLEKLKEELMQDELKRRPRYIIYAGWNAPKQVEAEYHGAFGSTNIPQELLDLVRRPDPEPNTLEGGT